MKFGIILTAYNFSDTIDDCLRHWVKSGHEICAVSVPYKEYKEISPAQDNTAEIIKEYGIHCFTEPRHITEAEARNLPFNWLKEKGVDFYWILDADEIYTKEDIDRITNFVSLNPQITYFNINFKNYVFDGKCWVDGFCPPRVFSAKNAEGFFWDNDISYNQNGERVSYKTMPSLKIPRGVAHVKHLTWISNERSKRKIEYQEKHFKHGAGCSYKWNDEKNCLEFNMEYFNKTGEAVPELNHE